MKITYNGPEETITEAGLTFVKGKAVEVPDDHPRLPKLSRNPTFTAEASKAKAAKVEQPADEPGPLDSSIPELTEHLAGVDDADEVERLIAAEKAGKSRSGALAALEARRDELKA